MSGESQDKPIDLDPDREALRASHKKLKQKQNTPPPVPDPAVFGNNVELNLQDSESQTGQQWRANKVRAIWKALNEGHTPEWIMLQIRIGGATRKKALELFTTAIEIADSQKTITK